MKAVSGSWLFLSLSGRGLGSRAPEPWEKGWPLRLGVAVHFPGFCLLTRVVATTLLLPALNERTDSCARRHSTPPAPRWSQSRTHVVLDLTTLPLPTPPTSDCSASSSGVWLGRFGPIQWVPPPHSVFSVGQTELIREPHSPLSWLPPLLADPIAQVHQAFCKNLLERAVESLVKPQAKKKAADQEEESWYGPWICPPPPRPCLRLPPWVAQMEL